MSVMGNQVKHFWAIKRGKIIIGFLIMIIVLSAIVLPMLEPFSFIQYFRPPQNVFEEMYNDRVYVKNHPMLANVPHWKTSYPDKNVFFVSPDPWAIGDQADDYTYVLSWYDRTAAFEIGLPYLSDDEHFCIYYYKDRSKALIFEHEYTPYKGEKQWCRYTYDMKTKELSYKCNYTQPNNEADRFLYDRILTDWFQYNAEESAFSMDDLGEFKDIGRVESTDD